MSDNDIYDQLVKHVSNLNDVDYTVDAYIGGVRYSSLFVKDLEAGITVARLQSFLLEPIVKDGRLGNTGSVTVMYKGKDQYGIILGDESAILTTKVD